MKGHRHRKVSAVFVVVECPEAVKDRWSKAPRWSEGKVGELKESSGWSKLERGVQVAEEETVVQEQELMEDGRGREERLLQGIDLRLLSARRSRLRLFELGS